MRNLTVMFIFITFLDQKSASKAALQFTSKEHHKIVLF